MHETNGLLPANAKVVRAASALLARMGADLGGTEMPAALREVFALGCAESAADVLLITDGEIWDAEGLVVEARAAKQRVFVVGIGSAPAEGVLKRLAEASGGACEFVAPNEDAEGAILRMFARLRAPRVERAEVAWPATVAWTTPLPGGLFGGETIHAFAGFASVPSGEANLKLVPRDGAKALTSHATLPAAIVEDRTLARVAAARRIETASEAEQLKLALDHGLLTARTNLLVVHERAEGEKAKDLPELARVAQMHAAGWHGIGSVCDMDQSEMACRYLTPTRDIEFCALDQPAVVRSRPASSGSSDWARLGSSHLESAEPPMVDGLRWTTSSLADFLVAIEGRGAAELPRSLDELARAGVPGDLLEQLRALAAAGNAEADVVRAFYEALAAGIADGAVTARVSRQFVRLLRKQFGRPEECRELRGRVLVLVRAASGEVREGRMIV